MDIIITIPDNKISGVKSAVLREHPNTSESSDLEWVKKLVKDYLFREYAEGKKKLANDAVIIQDIYSE